MLGIKTIDPDDIFETDMDIFSPCALGGILNDETIPRLKCSIIAGGANNQLLDTKHGYDLHKRKIMKTVNEKLDDALELSGEIITVGSNLPERIQVDNQTDEENLDTDLKYTRENLYNLIERGTDAIEDLVQVAKESEHPRAYEVVGQLLKTVSETNGKLLEIHKIKKDITREEREVSIKSQNVTNALFVGSTAELQKLLNGKAEK